METNGLTMLAKVNRLKKKKDFDKVFKEGKGFKEDFLFLKFVKSNLKQNRFGFIISQKVSKKATVRNRIRRRLKGLIKGKLSKINKGIDVVLIAKPGLETKDFWEIEDILTKLLKKAKILPR